MSDEIVSASNGCFQPTLVDIPNGDLYVKYALEPEFAGHYAVGDEGSVWSRKILFSKNLSDSWSQLALFTGKTGYLFISAPSPQTGKYRPWPVHRMVLEAWRGPKPEGMFGRHLNGNRKDNRLENLAWGTHSENMLDRGRYGEFTFRGNGHPQSVLTDETVIELRRMVADGMTVRDAAQALKINIEAAYGAANGRSWSHLPGAIPSKRRKLTREQKEEIKSLARSGMIVQQIMEKTGLDYYQVYTHAVRPSPTTR